MDLFPQNISLCYKSFEGRDPAKSLSVQPRFNRVHAQIVVGKICAFEAMFPYVEVGYLKKF